MVAAAEQSEGEILPGTVVLGRYQVLGKLAQGGMAEVYLARQVGPGGYQKLVVTKRVRPHLSKDEDFVGMFVNEARLAAMINHPNVVQIFDLGEEDAVDAQGSDWFLAMEYLDGRDMLQVGRACRSHNKAVPFDVTARIIADACAGLEHAHQLKGQDGRSLDLVHRDMSPENIIITFEGQVKVVDFGIAKAADNSIRTQAGQIKGKLGYVAPEAILGKPVDARADIFAVGATLYLFLSGRPAFTGNSPMEIFERSLKAPPSPQEVNPRVPPVLDEICMKALAQDRDKRYRSAGEVRAALDAYLSSTGRPLGAPQLAQFMRILFPPDKDPVRQRIDKLLLDAQSFGTPKKAQPRTVSTPQIPVVRGPSGAPVAAGTMPAAQAPIPQPSDQERTAIVKDHATQAPMAVDIPGLPPQTATVAAPRPNGNAAARAMGPSHLRSVGVSDEIPDVSNPRAQLPPPPVDDSKTQLTGRAQPDAPGATAENGESYDVVKTMDIQAMGASTGQNAPVRSSPPAARGAHLDEATLGGLDVDIEDEIANALADDPSQVDHIADVGGATMPSQPAQDPASSLAPRTAASDEEPATQQQAFQRNLSERVETGLPQGTELAPPSFEASNPAGFPPPIGEEPSERDTASLRGRNGGGAEPLFAPPDTGLARGDELVNVMPDARALADGPVSVGVRIAMAGLGVLTGALLLFILLAVTHHLSDVIGP